MEDGFALGLAIGEELLPVYDWEGESFSKAQDNIAKVWFEKNPKTTRGTGEFKKQYPEKYAAIVILNKMTKLRRITPEEYLALYKEIFNF